VLTIFDEYLHRRVTAIRGPNAFAHDVGAVLPAVDRQDLLTRSDSRDGARAACNDVHHGRRVAEQETEARREIGAFGDFFSRLDVDVRLVGQNELPPAGLDPAHRSARTDIVD